MRRVLGLAIFGVGVVLLLIAYSMSQSFGEQVREIFTGNFSEETTWYFLGGLFAVILGGGMAIAPYRSYG